MGWRIGGDKKGCNRTKRRTKAAAKRRNINYLTLCFDQTTKREAVKAACGTQTTLTDTHTDTQTD